MRGDWSKISLIVIVAIVGFTGDQSWCGESEIGKSHEVPADFYLPIICLNDTLWKEEIYCYERIPGELQLNGQLEHIADFLSRRLFGGLPIKLSTVEEVDGRRTAVIDLREFEDSSKTARTSWRGRYFQGSSGGAHTSTRLIGTFLQKGYSDEWVDCVRFLYEGKSISGEWDHIPELVGAVCRDST